MRNSIPLWVSPYIGLKFDMDVQHCWWLVRKVLKEQCNIDVPEFTGDSARELIKVARHMKNEPSRIDSNWISVDLKEVRSFDVVQMFGKAGNELAPIHVGIAVNSFNLLHIEIGTDSVVVPFSSSFISKRLSGFYRHKNLT